MKKSFIILFILILSNCSVKKSGEEVQNILDKSDDLMSLTFNEYLIYIYEYSKNSKYPDLNNE